MQRRIEENMAAVRANPSEITQLAPDNNQIKENIANAQKLLAEFEQAALHHAGDLPPARPLLLRARSQMGSGRGQPGNPRPLQGSPEREPALFGLIVALADVNQPERAQERCEEYLRDFKNGPNAATVGYLLGAVALQAGDPKAARDLFRPHSRVAAEEPVPRADSLSPGEREIFRGQLRRRGRGL